MMNKIDKQIELVKDLVSKIHDTRSNIINIEEDIKVKEAKLWLDSDWETLLNKTRPTEKDKTSFITNDEALIILKKNLKLSKAKLESLRYNYDIEYSILKFLMNNEDL